MAVTETSYSNGMFITLSGTLAEVMDQLATDGISLSRCKFIYDAGNSKFVCIYS
jgi:hypothetical protein